MFVGNFVIKNFLKIFLLVNSSTNRVINGFISCSNLGASQFRNFYIFYSNLFSLGLLKLTFRCLF